MAIWRSPLTFIGIAIILVVAAALVAPFVIDFNRFKPQLEEWGGQLTGREVRVNGDVRASLFPWPSISLHNVTIANPPGSRQPYLLEAEEIRARLSLAALLSARINVEQVHFVRPALSLERLNDGSGSWRLSPRDDMRRLFPPERISFQAITIEDGVVFFIDARRGGEGRAENVNARLSAPRLSGPWKLSATAALAGTPVSFSLATGRIVSGQPVSFSARLSPLEDAGFLYTLDGRLGEPQAGLISARLRVRPVPAKGKQDRPVGFALFSYSADVEAGFDEVWLKNFEAVPLAASHSASTVSGTLHAVLGQVLEVDALLKTSRFDLDHALGGDARRILRDGFSLPGLAAIVGGLPPDVILRLDLTAASLLSGGEALESLRVALEATSEELDIRSLSTSLPGGSRLSFSGRLLAAVKEPQLSGAGRFTSRSFRDFVLWALPEQAPALRRIWTGARGQLEVGGEVDMAPGAFRLTHGDFVLDGGKGEITAGLRRRAKGGMRLDLSLAAARLDIDRYAPSGLAAGAGEEAGDALSELLVSLMSLGESAIDIEAGELNVFGLPMRKARFDVLATPELLEVRAFRTASLKGAAIDASAMLRFPDGGVDGSARARITGEDITPLWRLLAGLGEGGDEGPRWLANMGGMDITMRANAASISQGARLKVVLEGSAGPASMKGKLEFTGRPRQWRSGHVAVDASLKSAASRPIMALFGLRRRGGEGDDGHDAPAEAGMKLRGVPEKGLETSLSVSLLAGEARFLGRISAPRDGEGLLGEGRLALRASRSGELLRLLGLGAPEPGVTAYGEGELAFSPGHALWRNFKGAIGGNSLSGEIRARWGGEPLLVSGQLHAARLDMASLARAWLTSADGGAEGNFRKNLFGGPRLDLRIAAREMKLLPGGPVLPTGMLELSQEESGLRVRLSAGGKEGRNGKLLSTIRLTRARAGLTASGEVDMSLPLAAHLRLKDGSPAMETTLAARAGWQATARSLTGMAAAMNGQGDYELSAGRLLRASPGPFLEAARKAPNAARLDELAKSLLHGGTLEFPALGGRLEIKSGLASFGDIAFEARGFKVTARPIADLRQGKVDISIMFVGADAPPFGFALAGPPSRLAIVDDLAELGNWVTVSALRRSMENLERVERQRMRVLEEESAFERRQEMLARWREWHERKLARQRRLDALVMGREEALRRWVRKREEARRKREEEEARKKREEEAAARRKREEEAARRRKQAEERRRRAEMERKLLEQMLKDLDTGAREAPSAPARRESTRKPLRIVPPPKKPSGPQPLIRQGPRTNFRSGG